MKRMIVTAMVGVSSAFIAIASSGCSKGGGSGGATSATGTSTSKTSSSAATMSASTGTSSATASSTGTGGGCTAAHMTIDPADGKCKLDGTTTNIGVACPATGPNALCGTDANATCNDMTADGFPKGYCSDEPCSAADGHLCPVGASCAHLGGETNACWKNCASDADCRVADGYACTNIDPLYTSGASHKVCYLKTFPCMTMSTDCPAVAPTCTAMKCQ